MMKNQVAKSFLAILCSIIYIHQLKCCDGEECIKIKATPTCPENVYYKPWANDEEGCNIFNVTLLNKNDDWKPRALVMFPHWSNDRTNLRQICITSLPTLITYYNDAIENGRTNEKRNVCLIKSSSTHKTILQRTVGTFYDLIPDWYLKNRGFSNNDISLKDLSKIMFDYRGFLFVRNPWISISEFRFRLRGGARRQGCSQYVPKSIKRSLRADLDFDDRELQVLMELGAGIRVASMKEWISNSPHGSELPILQYEDLVQNPAPEMIRIMKYLKVPMDEKRRQCTLKHAKSIKNRTIALPMHTRTSVTAQLRSFHLVNQILTDGIDQANKLL